MALKRRTKISAEFSMASMTDIIFLLLLFFMITATMVQTNAIKVMLPRSSANPAERVIVRITIDANRNFFIARGNEREQPISFNEIETFLHQIEQESPDMYVALYADETVPYGEVIRVLDVANQNQFRLVLATRPLER